MLKSLIPACRAAILRADGFVEVQMKIRPAPPPPDSIDTPSTPVVQPTVRRPLPAAIARRHPADSIEDPITDPVAPR